MKKGLKISLIASSVVLLIALTAGFSFSNNTLNKPNIYSGVKIKDIDVGGLSQKDAKE